MKTSDSNKNNGLDDQVEAYLDNELSDEERVLFEQLLENDANWQQELLWATSIRDELRAIPTPDCPPNVGKTVMKMVLRDARPGFWPRFLSWLNEVFQPGMMAPWKPALATLTLLVVATVFVFVLNKPEAPSSEQEAISRAEVEQALAEAKWALGYVSKTGRLTGASMQDALAPLLKEQTKN